MKRRTRIPARHPQVEHSLGHPARTRSGCPEALGLAYGPASWLGGETPPDLAAAAETAPAARAEAYVEAAFQATVHRLATVCPEAREHAVAGDLARTMLCLYGERHVAGAAWTRAYGRWVTLRGDLDARGVDGDSPERIEAMRQHDEEHARPVQRRTDELDIALRFVEALKTARGCLASGDAADRVIAAQCARRALDLALGAESHRRLLELLAPPLAAQQGSLFGGAP